MKRVACIVLLSCLAATSVARAQPPATMSYQGVLTDGSGNLVPDGPYDLTFRLYTVASAGAAIWTEAHLAVPVVRGGFNVVLGGISPLTLPFDVPYWLGVTIGAGSELSQRTALAASPYTIAPRFPIETEIDYALGTSAVPGGNPYALLQTIGSFTKAFAFTDVELGWDGHSGTTAGAFGGFCDYQIRVDGNPTVQGNGRAVLYSSANTTDYAAFATTALFHGLAAGSHTVSVWLRGDATNCLFNNGNFPHAVFVREFQSVTGVATAPPARVMPVEAGLAVTGGGR